MNAEQSEVDAISLNPTDIKERCSCEGCGSVIVQGEGELLHFCADCGKLQEWK